MGKIKDANVNCILVWDLTVASSVRVYNLLTIAGSHVHFDQNFLLLVLSDLPETSAADAMKSSKAAVASLSCFSI